MPQLTSAKGMSHSSFRFPNRRGNLGAARHAATSLIVAVTWGLQKGGVAKVLTEAAMELSQRYLVDSFMEKLWITVKVNNSLISSTERGDIAWLWKKVILMCSNDCRPYVSPCVLELPRSFLFLKPPPLTLFPIFDCDMLAIFSAELSTISLAVWLHIYIHTHLINKNIKVVTVFSPWRQRINLSLSL